MKAVIWTDEKGYCHRSLIRDSDSDDRAAELGILSDPPDLGQLDWGAISAQFQDLDTDDLKLCLHNRLIQLGLITWADVQRSQNGLTRAIMAVARDREILAVLKRPLVALYRQMEAHYE